MRIDCAALVNEAFALDALPYAGIQNWLFLYAFAFQIYGDFSGYSDIARGVSKMFGIELMLNFGKPYLTTNPAQFWREWHISLSTWLRDYLYIPLGGNRGGEAMMYRNLMITMLLGGLWHGAGWAFIFWGLYQGILLVIHRAFRGGKPAYQNRLLNFGIVVVFFHFVCFGWLLFRCGALSADVDVVSFIQSSSASLVTFQWFPLDLGVARSVLLTGIAVFCCRRITKRLSNFMLGVNSRK